MELSIQREREGETKKDASNIMKNNKFKIFKIKDLQKIFKGFI